LLRNFENNKTKWSGVKKNEILLILQGNKTKQ